MVENKLDARVPHHLVAKFDDVNVLVIFTDYLYLTYIISCNHSLFATSVTFLVPNIRHYVREWGT